MSNTFQIDGVRISEIPYSFAIDLKRPDAPQAFGVRFKGHRCAAVGFGRVNRPVLLRAHKGEALFVSEVKLLEAVEKWARSLEDDAEKPDERTITQVHDDAIRDAWLHCARAIRRTEYQRRRLRGKDHLLRGMQAVERLLRDPVDKRREGSGKRWKIVRL